MKVTNKVTPLKSRRGLDGTLLSKQDVKKRSKYVIDLKMIKFDEEHVKIYEELYNTLWQESEPTYFGEDVHPAIEFSHFQLKPINDTSDQEHRIGGRVKDPKNVWRSLSKGFNFTKLPPAELRQGSKDIMLTGATRKEYLSSIGQTHYICAIYKPVEEANQYEVLDAISYMGQTLQETPASNPNSMEDVKDALRTQCQIFIDSKGQAGVNPLLIHDLLDRVAEIGSRFTEGKRHDMAYAVFNHYNPTTPVASWSSDKNAVYKTSAYMNQFKLVSSNKVRYICAAASTVSKVFTSALREANKYPDAEIRIVFHTSTLTGTDALRCYESVASKNIDKFNLFISDATAAFNGDGPSRISVYGILPAVGEVHSFNEPVLYDAATQSLYQRKHGYFFDMNTSEED